MGYGVFLKFIEVLGVLAFSLTGVFEARRLKMDVVGVYSLAMITAFGGGTVRDLCLQRYPLFWIQNWPYAVVVLVVSIISAAFLKQIRDRKSKTLELIVTIFDALGLGLFSILGLVYSLQAYPKLYFIAVLMGVITGCFGGVIRDIVGNKVPTVFRKSQLYATCSLAGCVLYMLFDWLVLPAALSIPLGVAATFVVRMLAVRFNISLPL
ncbi:MAG: trimeric intracellular cation channel family protein [Spirochaetia bacterium]|jgi:uncharacterized membrane protein YeiH